MKFINVGNSLLLVLILLATSCKKSDDVVQKDDEDTVEEYIPTANVYIAGRTFDDVTGVSQAVYWKNLIPVILTKGGKGASASAIAIQGNDVHVVGSAIGTEGNSIATYWKNGVQVNLTNNSTSASANGIAIQGKDIYISGFIGSNAVYWKNGELNMIWPSNGAILANTTGIAVNGNDIYVSGYQVGYGNSEGRSAMYWENNIPIALESEKPVSGKNILFHAGNTYVSASYSSLSQSKTDVTYWKNDTPIFLNDGVIGLNAVDIAVSDTYVYVACNTSKGIGYFKNEKLNLLSGNGLQISGIAVIADDAYISGQANFKKQSVATFWRNNTPVYLSTPIGKSGSASSIVVTPL